MNYEHQHKVICFYSLSHDRNTARLPDCKYFCIFGNHFHLCCILFVRHWATSLSNLFLVLLSVFFSRSLLHYFRVIQLSLWALFTLLFHIRASNLGSCMEQFEPLEEVDQARLKCLQNWTEKRLDAVIITVPGKDRDLYRLLCELTPVSIFSY